MPGTVNVLCAPPNGPNPGMATVDLAFAGVARAAGADSVRYWRLWDESEWLVPPGGSTRRQDGTFLDHDTGLTYELVRGRLDEFLAADAVVFWGDFLHMAVYLRHTTDVLTRRTRIVDDERAAARLVENHLLLTGQSSDTLSRVLSYGTTLSFNTAADYGSGYGEKLNTFLGGVRRVWHRDSYSATVAQTARLPSELSCKGTDAALLLEAPEVRDGDGTMAVFFGRSDLQPEPVALLGRALSRRTSLLPKWLPWGREPGFWPMRQRRRFRAAWPELEHEVPRLRARQRLQTYTDVSRGQVLPDTSLSTPTLLDRLAASSLVLTDTYHLAVNAWRLGIPAICLVDRPRGAWNVNSGDATARRDKREDFYSQMDATGLLVEGASLGMRPKHLVDRLVEYVEDDARLGVSRARIESMREHGSGMVVRALRGLLDESSEGTPPQ